MAATAPGASPSSPPPPRQPTRAEIQEWTSPGQACGTAATPPTRPGGGPRPAAPRAVPLTLPGREGSQALAGSGQRLPPRPTPAPLASPGTPGVPRAWGAASRPGGPPPSTPDTWDEKVSPGCGTFWGRRRAQTTQLGEKDPSEPVSSSVNQARGSLALPARPSETHGQGSAWLALYSRSIRLRQLWRVNE